LLRPTFGEKLRFLRKRAKLTQRDLAEQLGDMDQSFIALLERGKRNPTVEIVLKVSNLFHVTTDQLIRDELMLDDTTDTITNTNELS
jgi:transcriptional regulator with XRE-family HTH domain